VTIHDEASRGKYRCRVDNGGPASSFGVATRPHAGHHSVAPNGVFAEAQDKRDRRGTVEPHARNDECAGE
jgi:hypothetical protein